MTKKAAIYKIISSIHPDRVYIGSAQCFSDRVYRHIQQLNRRKHVNQKLQRHFDKYGESDLEFILLEEVDDKSTLLEREQYYIDNLKPFFNINLIAGSRKGMKNTRSQNEKISNAMKISMLGNKNGLGNKGWKGRKLSEEHRKKISDNHWTKKKTNEAEILLQPREGTDGRYKSGED